MEEIDKLQFEGELNANHFSSVFSVVMCSACLLIWGANEVGIFIVNPFFMRLGMTLACICLLIPIITYFTSFGKSRHYKYLLILCISLMAISIQTFLTFHGVMVCVFPVLLSIQYADVRVFRLAFWINLAGILFSIPMGYYVGCWDGNMIYATTYGVTVELDTFAARAAVMNRDYMILLLLYFALPRMVTYSVLSISLSHILNETKRQYIKQSTIRMEAELDGLTRLENRAKYNYRVANEYENYHSVFVAFIDVNFLKKMNDICGHEAGDTVLMRVAEEMRHIISSTIHGYRLGGDEFALIFCNYSEDEAQSLLREWENGIGPLNEKDDPIQCSLAIGSSFSARPIDIERVLKEADHNMYAAKLAMKALRTD